MKDKIRKSIKKAKKKIFPRYILNENQQRVFSQLKEVRDQGIHKFHLRLLKNGKGVLIIDAKYVLYLNHSAMIYMQQFIEGKSLEEIQNYFVKHYRTSKEEVEQDYNILLNNVVALISTEDMCPFMELGVGERTPFKVSEFPLRVDLAITYECNNKCEHCYVARDIVNFPELETNNMKRIMDKLWDVGLPHIALTGGEPTTREDFLELIEYGQEKGFVMGVITNGRRFADEKLVKEAIIKGLDYAQITLESHDKAIHDKMVGIEGAFEQTVQAIKNFEKEDIFFMTNTTLCSHNIDTIEETINFINELNIPTFACNGLIFSGKGKKYEDAIEEKDLRPILNRINNLARKFERRFIWYTPTQYCICNPIELGLGPKRCSAANISIAVEPNGDVLPCQSYYKTVGNILSDDWEYIWNSKLFKKIRNHEFIEHKCKKCDLLQICGGGCPLYSEHIAEKEKLKCKIANF